MVEMAKIREYLKKLLPFNFVFHFSKKCGSYSYFIDHMFCSKYSKVRMGMSSIHQYLKAIFRETSLKSLRLRKLLD